MTLIERLRENALDGGDTQRFTDGCPLCNEAADEIERLQAHLTTQPHLPEQTERDADGTLGELALTLCDALDDSVTLLEGWIAKYCNPRYTREHMNDVANKRKIIAAVRRQLIESKPNGTAALESEVGRSSHPD